MYFNINLQTGSICHTGGRESFGKCFNGRDSPNKAPRSKINPVVTGGATGFVNFDDKS